MYFKRSAFTMLELVFVIVIIGIIGKFGVEFLAQAYNSFMHSKVNNELQAKSEYAVEFIASRLQNRIKDSVIARETNTSTPYAIDDANGSEHNFTLLEWVGVDREDFRGTTKPNWSGIIDVDNNHTTKTTLVSPATNTTDINNTIIALSDGNSTINDAALYFLGSDSDIQSGYGWDGNITTIKAQNGTMHPINADTNITLFKPAYPADGNFTDIYEYYKLAWSAYAIAMEYNSTTKMNNLYFYYNFQPWNGAKLTDNNVSKSLLLENVSTFQFRGVGSIIKIQVCAKSTLLEDYSLCKEKTVF